MLSGPWFSQAFDTEIEASQYRNRHLTKALSRKPSP
jgi:hypothetical protein